LIKVACFLTMVFLTLEKLLDVLHEKNTWIFEQIFEEFTSTELQDVLDETAKIEKSGGEMTWDESRFRTSGGIFLRVLKDLHHDRMDVILKKQDKYRKEQQLMRSRKAVEAATNAIICPPELISHLIGKAGVTINALRTELACKIAVDAKTGRIEITGASGEVLTAARDKMQEKVTAIIANSKLTAIRVAEGVPECDEAPSPTIDRLADTLAGTEIACA